jgi:hypothetical protein
MSSLQYRASLLSPSFTLASPLQSDLTALACGFAVIALVRKRAFIMPRFADYGL